ncbi:VCBS repeat-containing protein [Algoriphagus algorifonticola]|uniref:VCBS repeat-containing protein n=1 Tax=Algoriphagus algorifonticola TaxID=2593007 RepID=UPI0011AAAA68|nr:VCBS repeat-containing protein [Algoriphagus algorifonticola]
MKFSKSILPLLMIILLAACKKEEAQEKQLFKLISAEESGIDFRNDLTYNEKYNPYTFRNFYNGAGVALGDINNDGLLDIFIAGNQTSNRLYLNKGNFKFEDITDQAGLNSSGVWSTGVSMADINNDGLLDIYVCKSGPPGGDKRYNELFINQGNLTFKEESKAYGIAEEGLSQHAVFFDMDKDGDLDMYLLSNSGRSVGLFDLREGQREIRDPEGGNKLFRNDGTFFTDVSEAAGIFGSSIGYGLGVTVADLNEDTWPDLYVSNDFFERDYLYLNNQDGTFREVLPELIPEISMGSMGADIADLDNDARPDIFVTEMLPEDWNRVKTKTPFEDWDKFQANLKAGYHRQFTRNTLQKNIGKNPNTGAPMFTEVSRMTGMHATDWSWGALIFDADLDGLNDVFVANGIVKDLTDFDFVDFYVNKQSDITRFKKDSVLITKMIDEFPSTPLQNYWFKNLGNWSFENKAMEVGLNQLTFSTGAAYGDLDNDGDLDLVVNNLNDFLGVYKNQSIENQLGNYITIDLKNAFGAKVELHTEGQILYKEYQPVKGYMSSVDPRIHFGIGQTTTIDSLIIAWPDGSRSIQKNIAANQVISPQKNQIQNSTEKTSKQTPLILASNPIPFRHQESQFIDFDLDRLRFWSISNEGPKAAVGDLNQDGRDDIFLPGAKGQASQLFYQQPNGSFQTALESLFQPDSLSEDVDALIFDANNDQLPDLLIASGGIEFGMGNPLYQNRLYINQGNGKFLKSQQLFDPVPSSFILATDIDQDGDLDLVIGDREQPFAYGIPTGFNTWLNDGKGNFTKAATSQEFKEGMLTSGSLADLDGDGQLELIIAGEWAPIRIFSIKNEQFYERTEEFGFSQTRGLWNTLLVEDLNGDGKPDILAGNMGLNTRLKPPTGSKLRMYINDFDQNGSLDQILCFYDGNRAMPLVMKNTLLKQIPSLRKQLTTYAAYQNKTMEELFPAQILSKSLNLEVDILQTSLWINDGNGKFKLQELPVEVQQAPIYTSLFFQDSKSNDFIILAGNQSRNKPEMGSNLGSYGWLLSYSKNDTWKVSLPEESGLVLPGESRDLHRIIIDNKPYIIAVRNNDEPILFEIR